MESWLKKENIIFGLIGTLLSIYVFWKTSRFPVDKVMGIGPAFFPRILAIGLIIFSIILIILNLFKKKEAVKASFSIKNPEIQRVAISLVATIVYVLCMSFFGFIISTTLYLMFLMYLMKLRKWMRIIIVSVAVSVVIYTIFKSLLNISLPSGFWV